MAVLRQIIEPQNFELVRDRIASILLLEIEHQVYLGSDVVQPGIYVERMVPFDKTELPCINVQFGNGKYDGKDVRQAEGGYNYFIDCHCSAPSTSDDDGDVMAMQKMQRLMGVCRAILENPSYRTLDFTPPSLTRVRVMAIDTAAPGIQDGINSAMGRITFNVQVEESVELKTAVGIANSYTGIKLNLTDKGYKYIANY